MKTFIRMAEVWTPTDDDSMLVLSSGLFPDAPAFEAITRQMVFLKGEGLPGRAWAKGHPLMMRELVGSYFKRLSIIEGEFGSVDHHMRRHIALTAG